MTVAFPRWRGTLEETHPGRPRLVKWVGLLDVFMAACAVAFPLWGEPCALKRPLPSLGALAQKGSLVPRIFSDGPVGGDL